MLSSLGFTSRRLTSLRPSLASLSSTARSNPFFDIMKKPKAEPSPIQAVPLSPREPELAQDDGFSNRIYRVDSNERVIRALEVLFSDPNRYWACDTEVADIDVKSQGPVGNGRVTCMSLFGGPDVDFGEGPRNVLWIDNYGDCAGLLQHFKDWLQDPSYKKVWHNYGFDRHVLFNEGIDCKGLGGGHD